MKYCDLDHAGYTRSNSGVRITLLLILVFLAGGMLLAQDTLNASVTPFSDQRFILGARAFLNSRNISYDDVLLSDTAYSNNFSFEMNAGYFIRDRLSLGLEFKANRVSTTELVKRELETLNIGPFIQFYLSPSEEGSVFIRGGVSYSRLRDELLIDVISQRIDRETLGNGINSAIGIGYSYVLYRRVVLTMQINYQFAYYDARTNDNVTGLETNTNVKVSDFVFGFGIEVLLGK